MLEDIWNGILELTARFVIPDWGALIQVLIGSIVFLALTTIVFKRLEPAFAKVL